jgi:hypothetical protein
MLQATDNRADDAARLAVTSVMRWANRRWRGSVGGRDGSGLVAVAVLLLFRLGQSAQVVRLADGTAGSHCTP